MSDACTAAVGLDGRHLRHLELHARNHILRFHRRLREYTVPLWRIRATRRRGRETEDPSVYSAKHDEDDGALTSTAVGRDVQPTIEATVYLRVGMYV